MSLSEADIVHRLTQARLIRGLTQDELARKIGISSSQISRIESGKRGLAIDLLTAWAQALELEADFLLWNPLSDKEVGVAALVRTLDDDGVKMVRQLALALPEMSPPTRQMVLQILDLAGQRRPR
jgi:transcriptional regulator with XRE-family HTH domain